jgi:WD40 repeat protein
MRRLVMTSLLVLALALSARGQAPSPAQEPEPTPAELQGQLRITLDPGGHTGDVFRAIFTNDGRRLVTTSIDQSIRVWDLHTGETVQVIRLPGTLQAPAVALSPDGRTLAAASCPFGKTGERPFVIYLIALADGRVERSITTGHTDAVKALVYSHDGKQLASASADKTVRLFDAATGEAGAVFKAPTAVGALAFSPDGKHLAQARAEGCGIRDLAGGKFLALKGGTIGPKISVSSKTVAWSPDGKTIATCADDGLRLWSPDGTLLRHIEQSGRAYAAAFSPDSRRLVVAWWGAKPVAFYTVATGKELALAPKAPAAVPEVIRDVRFSPDGQRAVLTGLTRGVHEVLVVKAGDGSLVKRLSARSWLAGPDVQASWGANGKGFGWMKVADPATWKGGPTTFRPEALEFGPARNPRSSGAVVHQGAITLKAVGPDTVHVLRDGKLQSELKLPPPATFRTRPGEMTLVGPDRAAVAIYGHGFFLYDTNTGQLVRKMPHPGWVTSLAPSPDGRYLMSLSEAQTLRIWEPKEGKALLALYVSGHDWIVWTSQGYYAATPGGEALMGWTVDHGADRLPSFYPAEQFRSRLYRPDVIKLVLEKGSVAEAVKAADAVLVAQHAPVPRGEADPEKLLPPAVTLTVLDQKNLPRLTVRATAKQGCKEQPVKSLRLLVDGRPLPGSQARTEFPAGQEKAEPEATWEVELPPGKHALSVLARTKDDTPGFSSAVEVACPLPEGQRPAAHLIAVGISRYDRQALNLHSADSDARHLAEALAAVTGPGKPYRPGLVRPLLNEQAGREAVLAAIDEVRKAARPNDLFVFAFAGHGARADGEFFLATREADPSSPESFRKTSVSGADLRAKLADFPCQVLLLLDACHSGAVAAYRPGTDEAARALSDVDVRAAVMCAALGHEEAIEDAGGGLFTQAVVRALKGDPAAFYDHATGELNVYHLQAFVYQEVTKASDAKQTPYLKMPLAQPAFVVTQFPK